MKDAYYFPHDSNARNDVKILKLRRVHGAEGYGYFWMLVEVLREQQDFKLPLNSIKELAFDFRCADEILFSIIKNFELFQIENNEFFYSQSLIDRLQPYLEKSSRARAAALKRWNAKADAKALQMQSKSNTKGDTSKVKKSKVNKSKEFNFKKELLNLEIEESIIDQWLKVRKQKKGVNTEIAFNSIKKEIDKSSLSANDCIKKAVEKSWCGFEASWIKNTSFSKIEDDKKQTLDPL
jgi:hypothetical protein